MSSTLPPCGPSGSATKAGCSNDAQPRTDLSVTPTDNGGTVGLLNPLKIIDNFGAATSTKKRKCREQRATEPDALTIEEAIQRGPAGKGKLYQEIAAGRLVARKIGRRTVILRSDYERWLNALPTLAGAIPPRRATGLKVASAPPWRRGRPRKAEQQSAMADGSTPSSRHCELCAEEDAE